MNDLTARVERLERQNRRLQFAVFGLAAVGTLAGLMAAAAPVPLIEAETVHVTKRLLIGDIEKSHVALFSDGKQATAMFRDANGKRRIVLSTGDEKTADLLINDADEKPRVHADHFGVSFHGTNAQFFSLGGNLKQQVPAP